ncbi:hypothetical protein Ahy_B09g095224 [Arachis hypogaea]|uniref:Uncharacterized protein n=1 Tax=Arachis hypogaea TaxID=3818 RepID=A0A444XD78_ARAHY|nr:hypothetical protein Ahy_B09g095224 [Arachis hypogaea]
MITIDELSSIFSLEWITDYKKAFPKEQVDVHTTTLPTITHNSDGTPVNTIPCIATLRSYEEEFPPLVTQTDEKKITRSQNKLLLRIDHTLDALVEKTKGLSTQLGSVAEQIAELRDRLSAQAFQLDQELKAYIDNRYFGLEFYKKNRELDQVKAQLRQIEMDRGKVAVPQALAIDPLSMYPKPYPSYSPTLFPSTYSPPETPDYESIFKSTYHLARQANTKKSISPQGSSYSSQPSLQPKPRPPWKPENFFKEDTPFNVPTKDKGIKEGSPTPGRTINTLAMDNRSHSEKITDEFDPDDETTETNGKTVECSEEDLPPKRSIFTISSIASITTRIPKGSSIPEEELGYLGSLGIKQIDGTLRPHFDLKVKTSVYDKPIKVVALMDTGSCATILKPHVLPKEMWAPFFKRFAAANSEVFTINLISKKPIGLEIFAC